MRTRKPMTDRVDYQCARCGSSVEFEDCWNCGGEGMSGHDCGEDCCCCADPEDNVRCDICHGKCSFGRCLSRAEWCEANPLPGREKVMRGEIERITVTMKGH